uniref:Integrase core domain containing protein n=1 Tax=Solanum tuberosum TaxID=4113 RepID=M1DRD1_SOLTU
MWTTVCRSIYGPFYTSVVSICNQYYWSSDPRNGSTDRRSVYELSANGLTSGFESAQASGSKSSHASESESAHVAGSNAKLATRSGENDQAASSDEATSSESVPAPRNDNPTPVAGEPNRWCVEGQWQIYRDSKMKNDKEQMARLITEERRVLTGSLHTVPDIHRLFNLHKDSRVPIWHCDRLIHHTRTLDIGLIRDEANMVARHRDPQVEAELASLGTDVDAILATPIVEHHVAHTALADDTVLDVLFSRTVEEGLEHTHVKGKRHRSSFTKEEKYQKRQRRQDKEARKASILDEELRQRRVRECVAGASSSAPVVEVPPVVRDVVSTIDGAMMDDVGTTEGDPTIVPAGSEIPDPPTRS